MKLLAFDSTGTFAFDSTGTFAFDSSLKPSFFATDSPRLLNIVSLKIIKHHTEFPPCDLVCNLINFFIRYIQFMKKNCNYFPNDF